jgi:hypothetical protein
MAKLPWLWETKGKKADQGILPVLHGYIVFDISEGKGYVRTHFFPIGLGSGYKTF